MSVRTELNRVMPDIWRRRGLPAVLLLPLAAAFLLVSATRRLAFRLGILRSIRVGVPVIVVGNVTVGGSGKTPLVIWLVERLRERGLRPGVISRGYGRAGSAILEVRPDGEPGQAGDEPLLIARRTGAPVFVGSDRVGCAQALLAAHPECDLIVSDDGLQHYRLHRDAEIVVFDDRGAGNGWLLPAGPLREPLRRLRRAGAVVANGMVPASLQRRLPPLPVFSMSLEGGRITRLADGYATGVEHLRGVPLHLLAGVGNPSRFFAQMRAAGLDFEAHAFPDHHAYRCADLDFGDRRPVLMTEKDAVKCAAFARQLAVELWALRVDARLEPDLLPLLLNLLESAHGSAPA